MCSRDVYKRQEQDFDGFLDKLKKYPNIEYLGDLIEHSWGQRVIRFYDLDGHIIEAVSYTHLLAMSSANMRVRLIMPCLRLTN